MNRQIVNRLSVCIALAAIVVSGCSREQETEVSSVQYADVVMTSFYPTAYFARRIGGGLVDVECPVPEGEDPIFWRPSRHALGQYANAKLIVVNGAGYEKWTQQANLPASRVVNTASAFSERFLSYESETTHSHGPAGEHSHEGVDGHTWLDPINAKMQAAAMSEAMAKAWPQSSGAFADNVVTLNADLDELDRRYTQDINPNLEGVKLLASHPAYNYLSARYNWNITNLDLDPAEGLTDEVIAIINEAVGNHEGKIVLLWEQEPAIDREMIYPFANITFDPAELSATGTQEASPDYIGIMNANIDRLSAALE